MIFVPEILEVAVRQVFEDKRDVLVFCGKDIVEFEDVWVVELEKETYFANGIDGNAVFPVFVFANLFNGDLGGGIGAFVAEEDVCVCSLADILPWRDVSW